MLQPTVNKTNVHVDKKTADQTFDTNSLPSHYKYPTTVKRYQNKTSNVVCPQTLMYLTQNISNRNENQVITRSLMTYEIP